MYVIRRKSDGLILQDNAKFGGIDQDPYIFETVESALDNMPDLAASAFTEEVVEAVMTTGRVVWPVLSVHNGACCTHPVHDAYGPAVTCPECGQPSH